MTRYSYTSGAVLNFDIHGTSSGIDKSASHGYGNTLSHNAIAVFNSQSVGVIGKQTKLSITHGLVLGNIGNRSLYNEIG